MSPNPTVLRLSREIARRYDDVRIAVNVLVNLGGFTLDDAATAVREHRTERDLVGWARNRAAASSEASSGTEET